MNFTVIDKTTGKYPDCREIFLNETWIRSLKYYYGVERFCVRSDGTLILLNPDGYVACPDDRFEIIFEEE